MRSLFVVSILFLACGEVGCAPHFAQRGHNETLLPSELIAHAEMFDGQHVTVRGYVVVGAEVRIIADSAQGYKDPHGGCLGLDGPDAMFAGLSRHSVEEVSGVFHRTLCKKDQVCLYWCGDSGIELDKDVSL